MEGENLEAIAQEILDHNLYMTLATAAATHLRYRVRHPDTSGRV